MPSVFLKNLYIGLVTNANVAVYTPLAAGISAKIVSASAYNDDTADITLDACIVPSGGAGAAAASNFIYLALVVLRNPHDVLISLAAKGVASQAVTDDITSRWHMLNAISAAEGVETIDWADLNHAPLREHIFEWLLGIDFDPDWDARFAFTNI